MSRVALLTLMLLAKPALAVEDAPLEQRPDQHLICVLEQSCDADGSCLLPQDWVGMIVIRMAQGALISTSDGPFEPVDRFPTLDAAYPLPAIGEFQVRRFLVDLPRAGFGRRMAMYSQIMSRSTGEPGLLRFHQIFDCSEQSP